MPRKYLADVLGEISFQMGELEEMVKVHYIERIAKKLTKISKQNQCKVTFKNDIFE